MDAVLGTSDSLLTLLVADNISRIDHRSYQTLIGQGIGNIIAGLPGTGAHVLFAFRAFIYIAICPGTIEVIYAVQGL